jgi:hypothetical protein
MLLHPPPVARRRPPLAGSHRLLPAPSLLPFDVGPQTAPQAGENQDSIVHGDGGQPQCDAQVEICGSQ